MIEYNKLVRDKIPEIIARDGKKYELETVNGKELLELLNLKLQEELDEYYEDGSIDELADLVEVIYGILNLKNISREKFEKLRLEKCTKRGGFEKGYKLIRAEK